MPSRLLVGATALCLVAGFTLIGVPAAGSGRGSVVASEAVVSTVVSRPGVAWTSGDATSGTSVLTFDNVGCTAVDVNGLCTGGAWPTIKSAHWIWRTQSVSLDEASGGTPWVTFSDSFSVTRANATGRVAVVADDEYTVRVNDVELGAGTLSDGVLSFPFEPLVGENSLDVTARSLAGPADPYSSPAGVAYKVTLSWQPPPPKLSSVVDGVGEQYWPTATDIGLAWVDYRKRTGSTVWFKPTDRVRTRVNPRGTYGAYPTLVAGTDMIVYQQYSGRESGIFQYDTSSGRRTKVRGSVNSTLWEFGPVASSSFILFLRCRLDRQGNCGAQSLLLLNRASGRIRVLMDDVGKHYVVPGFAGDRYVAWTDCTRRNGCAIRYFDSSAGRVRTQYRPSKTDRYAPAIDEATGVIFFGQYAWSRRACADTSVRRAELGTRSSEIVWDWPRGFDIGWSLSLTTLEEGRMDLYLERRNCAAEDGDIYRLSGVGYAPGTLVRQVASPSPSDTATEPGRTLVRHRPGWEASAAISARSA